MMIDDGFLLNAMIMLQKLKDQQKFYYILNKIVIDKVERYVKQRFELSGEEITLVC